MVPREVHPAPEPRHLSADVQTQARSFPDRGQARPPPGSPCPSAESTRSGLNVLTAESVGNGVREGEVPKKKETALYRNSQISELLH